MLYYNEEPETLEAKETSEGAKENNENNTEETNPTEREQEEKPAIYGKYSPEKIEQYKERAEQTFREIIEEKKAQQEAEGKERIAGTVQKWFDGKGYGFIEVPGEKRGVFCHISDTCRHLQEYGIAEGDDVYISRIEKNQKGTSAKEVLCDECISLEEWILREAEDSEILGIPKYKCERISGSGHKLEPTLTEKNRINQIHEEAEKDMNKWYDRFSNKFIETFGEPLDIKSVPEENKLVLEYPEPFGKKNVYASEAIRSGYFKTSLSENIKENDGKIYTERILDDFPEIHENISVVERCDSGLPRKTQEFKYLSTELQGKIIESLKDKLSLPEEIARKDFEGICEKRNIKKIRDDVNTLKAPGEVGLVGRWEKRTIQYGPSSDEYLPGGEYRTEERRYFLQVGILKKNKIIDPVGVLKEFDVGWGVKKTAEEVRDSLLEEKEKRLQDEVAYIFKNIHPEYYGEDYVLDRDLEEWKKEYQRQYEELIAETKEKWNKEDEETAIKLKERYDNYIEKKQKLLKELEGLLEIVNNCGSSFIKKEYAFGIKSAMSEIEGDGDIWRVERLINEILEKIKEWKEISEKAMVEEKKEEKPSNSEESKNREEIKEKKNETGILDPLLEEFRGDEKRARRFMENVETLDPSNIDEHILFNCGRDRRRNHFIEISGNQNFFEGADPNGVCGYIAEYLNIAERGSYGFFPERNEEEDKEKDIKSDDNEEEEDTGENGGDIMAELGKRFDVKVKKKK